jgi:hypothetical protein
MAPGRLAREGPPPGSTTPSEPVDPIDVTLAAQKDAPMVARAAVTAWMAGHVSETMLADARLRVSFGPHLADLLSTRWGVQRDPGTHIWAEPASPATC